MKVINLYVKASSNKNYIYNVYRDTNPDNIPNDILTLNKLVPIKTVNESLLPITVIPYTENLNVNLDKPATPDFMPFKFFVEPLYDDIHLIEITIHYLKDEARKSMNIQCFFDKKGQIRKAIVTDIKDSAVSYTNIENIEDIFKIQNNFIYINRKFLKDYIYIEAKYNIEVLKITDTQDETKLSVATGLTKPILDCVSCDLNISQNTLIKYLKITPIEPNTGVTYYYRVLAENPKYGYSNPSQLLAANLTQESNDIKFTLQCSTDYDTKTKTGTFKEVISGLKNNTPIEIGNVNNVNPICNIFNEQIPIYSDEEIKIEDYYIDDKKLIINVPNVWKNNNYKYNYRKYKAFRVLATLPNGSKSEPSEVITFDEDINIPIEKMILIKKDITNTMNTVSPLPTDTDIEIISTWIRKHGIYYDVNKHSLLKFNIQETFNDITIMNEHSTFDTLTFIDNFAEKGKVYLYTIYLYDCFKNISNPVSIIKKL